MQSAAVSQDVSIKDFCRFKSTPPQILPFPWILNCSFIQNACLKVCMQTHQVNHKHKQQQQQQQLVHEPEFSLPVSAYQRQTLKHVLLMESQWKALAASGQVKNLLYCSRTRIFTVTQVICAVARKQPLGWSCAVSFCKSRYVQWLLVLYVFYNRNFQPLTSDFLWLCFTCEK